MSVRDALDLYRTFTAKHPNWVTALGDDIQFPERIGRTGRALRIWYASDKWRVDNDMQLYVHTYDGVVDFCEPWRKGLQEVQAPRWPREIVQLGRCVAVEVERNPGVVRYPLLPDGTLLCATPDRTALVLVHPDIGILAVIVGGEQRVTERGIEG